MASERDLDLTLQKEVSRVVKQEASVTERDLNDLDKKIQTLVGQVRDSGENKTLSKVGASIV